jgi:hypothetical protein
VQVAHKGPLKRPPFEKFVLLTIDRNSQLWFVNRDNTLVEWDCREVPKNQFEIRVASLPIDEKNAHRNWPGVLGGFLPEEIDEAIAGSWRMPESYWSQWLSSYPPASPADRVAKLEVRVAALEGELAKRDVEPAVDLAKLRYKKDPAWEFTSDLGVEGRFDLTISVSGHPRYDALRYYFFPGGGDSLEWARLDYHYDNATHPIPDEVRAAVMALVVADLRMSLCKGA